MAPRGSRWRGGGRAAAREGGGMAGGGGRPRSPPGVLLGMMAVVAGLGALTGGTEGGRGRAAAMGVPSEAGVSSEGGCGARAVSGLLQDLPSAVDDKTPF